MEKRLTKSQKETIVCIGNHGYISRYSGFVHAGSVRALINRKLIISRNNIDYELTLEGKEQYKLLKTEN